MDKLIKEGLIGFRLFLCMLLLTGVLYTQAVTSIANIFFPFEANGSILYKDDKAIGSKLIGKSFLDDRYFHSRPSAVNYQTLASGASNLSPSSKELQRLIAERKFNLISAHGESQTIPFDLLTASASGLDPHISPQSALYQANRVIKARGLTEKDRDKLLKIIKEHIETRDWKVLGEERINVLALNLALDKDL